MAAERYQNDVLQMFYGPIPDENISPPLQPDILDEFELSRNNFGGWLNVRRMDILNENVQNNNITEFEKANEQKYLDLIERQIEELNSVKVSFGLEVLFSNEGNRPGVDANQVELTMHYFKEEPHVFTRNNKEFVRQAIKSFFEGIDEQINEWAEEGSGKVVERITCAYVNVARYETLRPASFIDLPQKLKNKKAIINVMKIL